MGVVSLGCGAPLADAQASSTLSPSRHLLLAPPLRRQTPALRTYFRRGVHLCSELRPWKSLLPSVDAYIFEHLELEVPEGHPSICI